MFHHLHEDIRAIFERDPSIRGFGGLLEIIFTYPGFHALFWHRVIRFLHVKLHLPFIPRLMMWFVRHFTGIEIHPGAKIGRRCVIDHGLGVVIGETSIVGDDVTMFQGVTLGGTGQETGKRHPTIGNHVTIGAHASVLGNITIGDHVRIGAGSVVVQSVPDHSTVIGVPGVIVRFDPAKPLEPLSHDQLPDPIVNRVHNLFRELLVLAGGKSIGRDHCLLREQLEGKPFTTDKCDKDCAVCEITRAFLGATVKNENPPQPAERPKNINRTEPPGAEDAAHD